MRLVYIKPTQIRWNPSLFHSICDPDWRRHLFVPEHLQRRSAEISTSFITSSTDKRSKIYLLSIKPRFLNFWKKCIFYFGWPCRCSTSMLRDHAPTTSITYAASHSLNVKHKLPKSAVTKVCLSLFFSSARIISAFCKEHSVTMTLTHVCAWRI